MKQPLGISLCIINIILSFILLSGYTSSWANNHSTLSKSTESLVYLNMVNENKAAPNRSISNESLRTFQDRRNQLIKGLEENPGAYLKYLLTQKQTSSLPTQLQPYIEHEVTNIEGKLEVLAALYPKQHTEKLQYVIHTDNGSQYSAHFSDAIQKNLQTGQRIRITHAIMLVSDTGIKHLLTSSNNIIIVHDVAATAIPTSLGPQKTFVFLVNFQDQPANQPWTLDSVKDTVFNVINNMYYESSYKQTTVVGNGAGWYTATVPSTADCGTAMGNIVSTAQSSASRDGIDLSSYTHFVYIFPYLPSCAWAGLGTVGGDPTSSAWINGYNSAGVIGHELGHNIGLYHSKFLKCSDGPNTGNCSQIEYGDYADIMGGGDTAHFNAFQKERLGWLNYQNSPPAKIINLSGTYTIDAYESANNNVKAIKIPKSPGGFDFYYLEFRQPIGFDSNLDCYSCDYTKGVLIHQGNLADRNSSLLLKMNPSDFNQDAVTLLPGKTFQDPNSPYGGVTITVNSVSAAGASITATFGSLPPTCVRGKPTMIINPATTQWVPAGKSVGYGIALKNNDNEYCSPSTYTFTTQIPTGLSASMSKTSLTLAPGVQGTTTIQVNSTITTTPGVYAVGITGTNNSAPDNVASINANIGIQAICIPDKPTVTLNPASQTGKRGQALTYGFTVKNNDSLICSSQTFAMSSVIPSKFTSQISPTTLSLAPGASSSGKTIITSNKNSLIGSYAFTLTATNNTNTAMNNSAAGTYITKK